MVVKRMQALYTCRMRPTNTPINYFTNQLSATELYAQPLTLQILRHYAKTFPPKRRKRRVGNEMSEARLPHNADFETLHAVFWHTETIDVTTVSERSPRSEIGWIQSFQAQTGTDSLVSLSSMVDCKNQWQQAPDAVYTISPQSSLARTPVQESIYLSRLQRRCRAEYA